VGRAEGDEGVGSDAVPGSAEAVLEALDPEQREVALALTGPVCVLAGAGTGKTRALTHRIAYGVRTGTYDPRQVLAVTFTTRAAAEMRSRLARLGVHGVSARTFHSAALAQVRYLWPRLYGEPFPDVLGDPVPLLRDLAEDAGVAANERDLAVEVAWAKLSNVAPHDYAERAAGRRVAGAGPAQVAGLYDAYVRALARGGRVDLEDVLLAAVGVLTTQPRAADLVRRRFRWFCVDEFQDVSGLQLALLEAWLAGRCDVCVVGDPAQAIYGFAGARPQYLTGFPARFPGCRVLRLTRSYRSTPQVLAAAAVVLADSQARLTPTRPAGPAVRLREAEDDPAEVQALVGAVRRLLATGTAEADVAVLVRTRADVVEVGRRLRAAGVAVSARGASRFFERPEVRQVVALLAAAARRSPAVPTGPATGGQGTTEAARPSLAQSAQAVLVDAGWSPDRPRPGRDDARWESWAAVVDLARGLDVAAREAGDPAPSLADLVDDLRERARSGEEPRALGVTVATLHATKGQEWRHVFIVGAHDGAIPSGAAATGAAGPEALEEERRLLYVGLTRARDGLTVSWAARRTADRQRRRPPSRFLAPLLENRGPGVDIRLRPREGGR